MSDFKIIGNPDPVVGKEEFYSVNTFFPNVLPFQNPTSNSSFEQPVKWEIYILENGRWRKTKENDKTGKKISYTFLQKSLNRKGIRILARRGEDVARLNIKTHPAEEPKIDRIELLDKNGSKPKKPLSYGQTVKARVHCLHMEKRKVLVTLWEDDVKGAGNAKANEKNIIRTLPGIVKNGKADVDFVLIPSFAKIAKKDGGEDKIHEYYVTTDFNKEKIASNNVDVNDLETPVTPFKRKVPVQQPVQQKTPAKQPVQTKPVTSGSPAQTTKEKAEITNVHLTDTAGRAITKVYKEKQIKVWIDSKGLIGKDIRLKLFDQDSISNDLLFDEKFTIKSNIYAVVVPLNEILRSKGGDNWFEGAEQEVFAYVEVIGTNKNKPSEIVQVDVKVFKPDPIEVTNKVKKVGLAEKKKEKFEKVKEKAEEAILYITSEIASEIKVDKNGNFISSPDVGLYNGKEEYKLDGKIYAKKVNINGKIKSAFPTYKAYIYRGNVKGEAVKKLKQDLDFSTHENADVTVLEVARHSSKNNKNYGDGGPIPPNSIDKLYGLKYKKATNDSGKTSYRYRIVDIKNSNFPALNDYKKEYDSGGMNIGSRSSISIDPWGSGGLVGCIGLRGKDGVVHPSCKDEYANQDRDNYKYIYHAINNYLEGVIPELTGIYGRRGFSTTEGKVTVASSDYDHEVKVFVLVDPLPEIDNCNCKKLRPPVEERENFYNSFGTKTINYISKKSKANKFKGLYMIAQHRKENGFSLKNIGNNPMNIKGSGDRGQIGMDTHETINGKYVTVLGEKFANFSSEDAGFQGYFDLLKSHYNDAYNSLFEDGKTIDDFTAGLEDTGKKGPYATGKASGGLNATDAYKAAVKELFNGVKNDYLIMYECKLCKTKDADEKKKIKEDIELIKKLK